MIVLRFLLLAFNVAIVTFLIYTMLQIMKEPIRTSRKATILIGGIILLLAPFGILFRIFAPTFQYLLIYPAAIAIYLYMIRQFKY